MVVLLAGSLSLASAQGLTIAGQAWGGLVVGSDPAPGHAAYGELVGYLPTFSLAGPAWGQGQLDVELAFKLGSVLDGALGQGAAGVQGRGDWYRLWGRYTTERLELRLGLQKIAFGPGFFLRPLQWFDTLDPEDPTMQTEGVVALRVRYYPTQTVALWGWVVRPDDWRYASPGGRVEWPFGVGEAGLTYYYRRATDLEFSGAPLIPFADSENRFGADLRLDIMIGLWAEAALAQAGGYNAGPAQSDYYSQVMVGGDYTIPWANGVYLLVEHLWRRARISSPNNPPAGLDVLWSRRREEGQFTALVVSYPLGFLDTIMAIALYDRQAERFYNYLRWQRTYDKFSFNTMLFANPERGGDVPGDQSAALLNFGYGGQLMLIYNH